MSSAFCLSRSSHLSRKSCKIKIKEGLSFKEAVALHSKVPGIDSEGLLGRFSRKDMNEVFNFPDEDTENLFALKKGEISDTLSSEGSHYIFQVSERLNEIPFKYLNKLNRAKA